MAIIEANLTLYLTGGASNTLPSASLGGVSSTTAFTDATIANLFANVTPAEALAGSVKYRALSFKNAAAETAFVAVVYISLETTSADTTISLAYDSTGTQSVVNEDTAPSGPALTFTTPLSLGAGIALGDVTAGTTRRIWFKRTVTAGAAQVADSGKIKITVGSAP